LLAIDTGSGFRNQVTDHLLDQRGAGSADDPLVGAWAQGYGIHTSVNSTDSSQGVSGSTAGVAGGVDFQITDDLVLGVAGGYSSTSLNNIQDFGGSISAFQIGGYGTMQFGQFYLDTTLWTNAVDGHVTREMPLLSREATATLKDDEFRADVEGGYRFVIEGTDLQNFGVTPYVGFNYRNSNYGDFSESGAGALGLNIKSLDHDVFQPNLGVTADARFRISDLVTLKPMVGVGLEFGSGTDSILAQFQGGGNPFTINGPQNSGVSFVPQAGFQFLIGPMVSLSFSYQGTFGNQVETQGGFLTLRGTW